MHANQGSLPQHYQPIPIDTTHVNPTQYNWTNVSLSGKTARSIQHRSNIKSVDLGPMPMPISRKFTSSDKMPILHIKCQYFTNLPIHNQSCPNTGQYIWPFRSYTGNKNSTGTDCWSPRRMISPLTIGWNYTVSCTSPTVVTCTLLSVVSCRPPSIFSCRPPSVVSCRPRNCWHLYSPIN